MLTRSERGYRFPRARMARSSVVSSDWRTSVYQAIDLNN
jgi:hypothetical protein